jgi:hypothetical protein
VALAEACSDPASAPVTRASIVSNRAFGKADHTSLDEFGFDRVLRVRYEGASGAGTAGRARWRTGGVRPASPAR